MKHKAKSSWLIEILGFPFLSSTLLIQVEMKTGFDITVSERDCTLTIETKVQKFKETIGIALGILDDLNTMSHD